MITIDQILQLDEYWKNEWPAIRDDPDAGYYDAPTDKVPEKQLREITANAVIEMGIGWIPDIWQEVYTYFHHKWWQEN